MGEKILKTISKKQIKENVSTREDGKATRAKLIDCAGRLIAEQGVSKVTAKEVCALAEANPAAINYHFGSRRGLYIAVLEEVHLHLLNLDALIVLQNAQLSSKEKMEVFFNILLENVLDEDRWEVKVWARELLNPTSVLRKIVNEKAYPKFKIVTKIFSDYTGYSVEDYKLYSRMLHIMSPFILVILAGSSPVINLLPVKFSRRILLMQLKEMALAEGK